MTAGAPISICSISARETPCLPHFGQLPSSRSNPATCMIEVYSFVYTFAISKAATSRTFVLIGADFEAAHPVSSVTRWSRHASVPQTDRVAGHLQQLRILAKAEIPTAGR